MKSVKNTPMGTSRAQKWLKNQPYLLHLQPFSLFFFSFLLNLGRFLLMLFLFLLTKYRLSEENLESTGKYNKPEESSMFLQSKIIIN